MKILRKKKQFSVGNMFNPMDGLNDPEKKAERQEKWDNMSTGQKVGRTALALGAAAGTLWLGNKWMNSAVKRLPNAVPTVK